MKDTTPDYTNSFWITMTFNMYILLLFILSMFGWVGVIFFVSLVYILTRK